jgi:hypothetical protein
VNRVGLPMMHPLFTQYNEDLGNRLNAGIDNAPDVMFSIASKTPISLGIGRSRSLLSLLRGSRTFPLPWQRCGFLQRRNRFLKTWDKRNIP